MKRIEKIYLYVKEKSAESASSDLPMELGVTTSEISEALAIQRTNASKDLNQLVRKGLLEKLDGRPVKYVDKSAVYQPLRKHVKSYREENVSNNTVWSEEHSEQSTFAMDNIFQQMIGVAGSMKTPVEQAKAAILYPPKGLNCLIIGPTGSGKTHFAHTMFQFAKGNDVVDGKKELIVFNCADYAHNPELLMSHLFGYVEGAFTGAKNTKEGIIHEADGGILFLDEVHRLPPEGQEMIFYFMDHGTYSRLGETTKNNQADVRIICATTENPASSLLNTFVRRIPIIIQLPNFNDRPAKEKVDLVKIMVAIEANRIQRKISLSEDVVKALIGSVTYGNVGQLKSNVQLVAARGFLSHMDKPELIITMDELTDSIKDGLMQLANNRAVLAELSQCLEPQMIVLPNESLVTVQSDSYELPYNLYEIIGDKAALLKADGLDQEVINNFITTDINVHLKSFYKNHGFTFDTEKKLAEIMDQQIIDITRKIFNLSKAKLGHDFQSNFIYAMSLHISSFLKRIQLGDKRQHELNENLRAMVLDYPKEFEAAHEIKKIIEGAYQLSIPESEVYYIAVLLISLRENKNAGRIGIVVAAHGKSTATSMVEVVEKLLNVDNLKAVDMPLEMKPQEALIEIVQAVEAVNEGSGVILLVDMGSLGTFSDEIIRQTGIDVRTVDMVTTPVVLEAARKTTLLDTHLNDLYDTLKRFRGYAGMNVLKSREELRLPSIKKKVILAICASGEGTAQRMKELIEGYLTPQTEQHLFVVPCSILDVKKQLNELYQQYHIIAATGITDPRINVPFIPMETFFSGEAAEVIEHLIYDDELEVHGMTLDEETARRVCIEYMEQSYTFINAQKVLPLLWQFVDTIQTKLNLDESYTFYINMIMHMAGVLERALRQEPLNVEDELLEELKSDLIYSEILKATLFLNESFKLKIVESEIYYIVHIVHNAQKDIITNTDDVFD
ncbi:sigma 54-interacting transcriptional regulator [Enterococcus sp. BWT-B8]|uniref:sigma-54-dependent transcriptional regulator n=1 Tax=unclassified Enterococcus TaxID=2608891 RepID=UPI001E4728DA|nr:MULTISPECIES: sigma-54-dependent transcriptional regulator [unclassified Enterococcus]MCB5951236.1 sigma 54-interacting transcriptional regulator [Enterococcus sp. BWT-B8]MCB5954819.1 sigma 54-interacting transcriptional regulator [Enterococcus sp. CWB-B31]